MSASTTPELPATMSAQLLFDTHPQPMWIHDPQSLRFLEVNEAAVDLYGYSREEFLGMTLREILLPEDLPALLRICADFTGPKYVGEWFHRKKTGETFPAHVIAHQIAYGGREVRLTQVVDVTERRRAETALRESEARFRATFESAGVGMAVAEADGQGLRANAAFQQMLGYSAEELLGMGYAELTHPDDLPRELPFIEEVFNGRRDGYRMQKRYVRKDGGIVWANLTLTSVRDAGGALRYGVGVIEDITAHREAAEALHEADQRAIREYERLVERIASLAQVLGTARDLVSVYRALCGFALASAPCTGLCIALYHPERQAREAVYAWNDGRELPRADIPPLPVGDGPVGRAIKHNELVVLDDYWEAMKGRSLVRIGEMDPGKLPALIAPMAFMGRVIGIVEIQNRGGVTYAAEHITAMRMAANLAAGAVENVRLWQLEREKEEQLRQSQKMEAVGKLAGGVAHDFNNLLTVINGYASLVQNRMAADDPLRAKVEEIGKAGDRASGLTRQLLAFSRQQVLQPKVLDLNDIISDLARMLGRLIGEDVRVTTTLDARLGRVLADPGQIEQVLLNLAVNARDAMPEGGLLSIETSNLDLDEAYARQRIPATPGPYVLVSVSDTGTGMDETTRARVFEPFFTTKEVGKGTGLGLATVYGIVKQSGGYIWVYSEPGLGTTFKIYLPRLADEGGESAGETEAVAEMPGGHETVLLVEDEGQVRWLATEILEMCGYRVLAAADGSEALATFEGHAGEVALVITDVVMPEMSGRQLAERLREATPNLPVLYMSGYTSDAVIQRGVVEESAHFIQKPFSAQALAAKVREALDAAR